ncbi:MAG: SUMF1/EgtB/PvdO family nonheme iron enzyme [Polyangiaceae bacterium]
MTTPSLPVVVVPRKAPSPWKSVAWTSARRRVVTMALTFFGIGAGLFAGGFAAEVAQGGDVRSFSTLASAIPVSNARGAALPVTHVAHERFDDSIYALAESSTLARGVTFECGEGMSLVEGKFCVDRWEASLVEVTASGIEKPWSPFATPGKGVHVRAVSRPHVTPQGYVSAIVAAEACAASGKRLCRAEEWKQACRGSASSTFGYGEKRVARRCNDYGQSPMKTLARRGVPMSYRNMNDPALNQVEHTVAKTGDHAACTNDYGVYDMVGNLHEWVDDKAGTFQGGYFQDTHIQGDGCSYTTTAHSASYHDYSTGFRCCADGPSEK